MISCRMVFHRRGGGDLGRLVLVEPGPTLLDRREDDLAVLTGSLWSVVGPHVPRHPIWCLDLRGHAFDLGRDDSGGMQCLPNDGRAVCLVFGQFLARPMPRHEDPAAADAEVFPV